MPKTIAHLVARFCIVDGVAVALLLVGWPLIGLWVEHDGKRPKSGLGSEADAGGHNTGVSLTHNPERP